MIAPSRAIVASASNLNIVHLLVKVNRFMFFYYLWNIYVMYFHLHYSCIFAREYIP